MNKLPLLLALGLVLGGCARKATPTKSVAGPGTSTPAVEPSQPAVKAQNTAFDYLSIKAKAQVTMKGDKKGANLSLRMRRDSVIWVSAGLAGFEGVRAVLTRDSVRVINKLEKTYFSGGYDYLSKLLNVPVSFEQMQTLLLGDYLPAPGGTTPTVATEEAGRQRVTYPLRGVVVEHLMQAGSTGRVQQLRVSDAATKRNLTVDYNDFAPLDAQHPLPFARAAFVQAQQPAGAVTAALNYNKVEVPKSRLTFPFDVPKGYRRIR